MTTFSHILIRLAHQSVNLITKSHQIFNFDHRIVKLSHQINSENSQNSPTRCNKLWLKINERCKPGAPKPKPYKKRPYKGKKPAKTQQK